MAILSVKTNKTKKHQVSTPSIPSQERTTPLEPIFHGGLPPQGVGTIRESGGQFTLHGPLTCQLVLHSVRLSACKAHGRHGRGPSLFRACFHAAESSDKKLKQRLEPELDPENDEFLTAPLTGRVRMLWMKCMDESQPEKSWMTLSNETLTDRLAWTDLPPPKLSPIVITKLKAKFRSDYPWELLNANTKTGPTASLEGGLKVNLKPPLKPPPKVKGPDLKA